MQASLHEKMHSKAQRQSSPLGSRLFVRNKDKAQSPDSPAWVCTPARVPEHDDGLKPSSAGQAQLNLLENKFSRNSNDECFKDSSRNGLKIVKECEKDSFENVQKNVKSAKTAVTSDNFSVQRRFAVNDCQICLRQEECICPISVQGTYHQGDHRFGETAGSQCVANCLSSLAYHKIKSSKCWKKIDMDKILETGNELYMFLQRSSTISNRFLLVDELPQYFECFNETFEFCRREPISSIIYLSGDEPNYIDFGACPLLEALTMALNDTDGCFICFDGNSLLICKTDNGYFLFDSHSRCDKGLLCVDGKSTRILLGSIEQIYFQLQSLAVSLGFYGIVECEIMGVLCTVRSNIRNQPLNINLCQTLNESMNFSGNLPNSLLENNITVEQSADDSVLFVRSEHQQQKFNPLPIEEKREICIQLQLPIQETDEEFESNLDQQLEAPSKVKQIEGNGNCFFRAISYCVAQSEHFHLEIRKLVCNYLLQNQNFFKSYLRPGDNSVQSHLLSTQMIREGAWATEIEILAVSHILKLDIYTYSDNCWLKYSAESTHQRKGSIYLDHKDENHYNVVLSISNSALQNKKNALSNLKKRKRRNSRKNQHHSAHMTLDHLYRAEQRRMYDRNRYRENNARRNTQLDDASVRYQKDQAFKEKCKKVSNKASKMRYANNITYKEKTIARSKQSINMKYRSNEIYQEKMKKQSVEKYKTNKHHRRRVKAHSVMKYKGNEAFKDKLKNQNMEKYRTNESFKTKVKMAVKKSYDTKANVKHAKKTNVKKQRQNAKLNLQSEDNAEMMFKQNSSKGIDYVCCCCSRLLFENQVQRCDLQMYEKNPTTSTIADHCIQEKYLHACSKTCQRNCTRSSLWICYTCHRKI